MKYAILVGNIGTVFDTNNSALAHQEYYWWRAQSKRMHGRAANEPVTLTRYEEPWLEYIPKQSEET